MFLTTALIITGAASLGSWLYRQGILSPNARSETSGGDAPSEVADAPEDDAAIDDSHAPPLVVQAQAIDAAADAEPTENTKTSESAQYQHLYLGASATAAVLAMGGQLLYPPLLVMSVAPLAVAVAPLMRSLWIETKKNGIRAVTIIDVASVFGAFALGNYAVAAGTATMLHASDWLIRQTEDRSRRQLFDIYEQLPERVRVEREGVQTEILIEAVRIGDIVVVNAGETIPVDGAIVGGVARLDERALTGESRAVERTTGESVHAMALLIHGKLWIRVERAGADCLAGQIAQILRKSTDYRNEIRARGQQIVEQGAIPTVALSLGALVGIGPTTAVAVLFGAIGYTMRYAAPLAVYGFLNNAARSGILVKDGRALEALATVDTVIFDKTGTLTEDALLVERVLTVGSATEVDVLHFAASAEQHQRHPIAIAIHAAAKKTGVAISFPDEVAVEVGAGLRVVIGSKVVLVGSERLMAAEGITVPAELTDALRPSLAHGATHIFVACDKLILGAVQLVARVRPEAQQVVAELRKRGCKLYIISGDQESPTRHLAKQVGIDNIHAQVLPDEKGRIVERLRAKGHRVCFIGDGINDAVALRAAHVGISLAGASTVAKDNAPIVLLDGTLTQLPKVFALARELDENLDASALLSIVPGVAITAAVLTGAFGLTSAIVAYNVSLVAAVGNGLRPMVHRNAEASPAPNHP